MDHDRLFKELLTTFFVEFVELLLPEVARYLDPVGIEFLDKEVFTDVTEGEKHEADLVVKARFRDRETFFLIHVENQAEAQSHFRGRMFTYFARLHEKYGLPVYPVALFSFEEPLRPEPDRFEVRFPDRKVLDFRFRVIQLNRLSWRKFVKRANPVASALMARMRIAAKDRPKVKLECLRLLATLKLNPAKARLISGFVDSYLRLSREEQAAFEREMTKLGEEERQETMELTTSWKEEGIVEGEARIVLRQLRRKLGEVAPEVKQRISPLNTEQLEELSEALLDFQQASDLTAWLDGRVPPT